MTTDPRQAKRAALRRATLHLVLGVVAVHGTALGIYRAADIAHASLNQQRWFTGVWTVATTVVVLFLLKRVRRIRMSS